MSSDAVVVGCDEAGCGCPFGPLIACAVSLTNDVGLASKVGDSKGLGESVREALHAEIVRSEIVGIGTVTNEEIDERGLGWARREVFHRALDAWNAQTSELPEKIVVDGTLFRSWRGVPYECVPKADRTVPCVSAASIVAKVTRDRWIYDICSARPDLESRYEITSNKGYPTKRHKDGIREHGLSDLHRTSYKLNLGA